MSSSGTRHYTRFIPGEEIAEAVRWRFGEVGAPDAAFLPAEQDAPREEPPEEAVAAQPTPAQLQQARDEAYAQGVEQGRAQAQQEWGRRLDDYAAGQGRQAAQRLEGVVQSLEESFTGLQQRMADELLQLACDIARQVVRQELQAHPRAMLPVVREALAAFVRENQPATVRLHPTDWRQLEPALREEFGAARVQWQPDPAVTPGGCSVECAGAVVDGTLETRWRRAIAALGLVSAWRESGDGD